jgi:outer membrane protein
MLDMTKIIKNIFNISRTAGLIFFVMMCSFSISIHGADLLEIFRLAKTSDPIYNSALESWRATQEKLPQGLSVLLPSLNLSASTLDNHRFVNYRDPTLQGAGATFNTNFWTLSVTQPIYRPQSSIIYAQSKATLEQSDIILALSQEDLILRVVQAYLDVLLAKDNLELSVNQQLAIENQLLWAKNNFEFGLAAITDVNEAQARYDLAISQNITSQNDLEVKTYSLKKIIGNSSPILFSLNKKMKLPSPEPSNIKQWTEEARKNNRQVNITESSLLLANQEVKRNRAGHYPTLDAIASWSENRSGSGITGGYGNDINSKSYGVQLSFPIFQGGMINSKIREAIHYEDKARQDLETARRNAEYNAQINFLGVMNSLAQSKAFEAALSSTQSTFDSSLVGLKVGTRTQVDVLNAQQQLFTTLRDSAQTKYNYINFMLKLKAAVGKLSEEDLSLISAWLEKK